MLVFVDESGDPGVKGKAGSSKVFVLTLIIFTDRDEANAVDDLIATLRGELGMHKLSEFKFNKLNQVRRIACLQAVRNRKFVFYSMVINKAKITSRGLSYKESFYKYACSLAFENARHLLDEATIIIDGSGSREFRLQLQSYLKKKMNDPSGDGTKCIRKVKIQDSKKNNLLQLADMVCGAVAKAFQAEKGDATYRKILKEREGYVQFWPK